MEKQCVVCGATYESKMPWAKYCSNKCNCAAKKARNPERYRAYGNAYYKANKASVRACSRKWKKANLDKHNLHCQKYRVKKRQGDAQGCSDWADLMVNPLVGKPCFYCGDFESGYHIDHHIPISRGGPHEPWNLRVACPRCNMSKSQKLPRTTFCEELFYV